MSASLLIANPGKKGARKFVLRQVSSARKNPRSAAQKAATKRMLAANKAKKAMRKNAWSEKRTQPVLKAPRHRAAAYKGKGYSPRAAAAKARKNPGEYRAAFNRLKADVAKAARKAKAARTNPRPPSSPSSSKKSVAQRLAALKARLGVARKNPTVRAKARKEKKMATKKRRSAAQKAATRKMIAANKRRGNPGKGGKKKGKKKGGKRRTAAQKAATKRMIAANRKGGGKKRGRKGGKRRGGGGSSVGALRKRLKSLTAVRVHGLKAAMAAAPPGAIRAEIRRGLLEAQKDLRGRKGKKRGSSSKRAVHRARVAGIRARLSGASSKVLRQYGLTRVNPSPMGILKDVGALAPQLGVAALAFLGVAVAGPKLIAALPQSIKDLWKSDDPAKTETRVAYAPVVGGVLVAIAAYFGARMYPKTSKWAAPVAFGGVAGAMLHALTAVKVATSSTDATKISLGKRLGLSIGEYVSVAGYVDVGGGRMMSVNGLGEYVSVAGIHQMSLPGGQSMRYEGSLGEYVLDPVGLSGGIFPSSGSLGELVDHTSSQVPLKRDPMWGLRGDPEGNVNIHRLLGQGDVAGMGGGIFDRNR